jgi:hypothetical protein
MLSDWCFFNSSCDKALRCMNKTRQDTHIINNEKKEKEKSEGKQYS